MLKGKVKKNIKNPLVKITDTDFREIEDKERRVFVPINLDIISTIKKEGQEARLAKWDPKGEKVIAEIQVMVKPVAITIKNKKLIVLEVVRNVEKDYLEGWLRAKADITNLQQRIERDKLDLVKYSKLEVILELLQLKDNFDQAVLTIPEEIKENAWIKGITYIDQQFQKILSDNNVSELQLNVGDNFKPEEHEAIEAQDEKKDAGDDSKIKKIFKKGYKLNDEVIRPAMVSL